MMRIHKEGLKMVLLLGILFALLLTMLFFIIPYFWIWSMTVAVAALMLVFVLFFFRYPQRSIVLDDEAVISPADGTVVAVKEAFEKEYLKANCIQVSIFMSLLNVHINWYPVGGRIRYYKYHAGDKLVAWHPKSSEKNEHTTIVVDHNKTLIAFRQIAGFIAQRIVCFAQAGKEIQQASEVGLIRFGSRVDLFLPLDSEILVKKGQKVRGQITRIAQLPAQK